MKYQVSVVAGLFVLALALLFTAKTEPTSPTLAGAAARPTEVVPVVVQNTTANAIPVVPQGTQNVNIVGGMPNFGPPVASKSFSLSDHLSAGGDRYYDVTVNGITTTINTSFMSDNGGFAVEFELLGPGIDLHIGGVTDGFGHNQFLTFPQRIPINRVHVSCFPSSSCDFRLDLVGD